MTDVLIIGGGPAGMMAAHTASKNSKSVLILERNRTPGRKLMITGKGRCNLTNSAAMEEFIKNTPVNGRFLFSAFRNFTNTDLMEFFENRGVKLKEERGGRIFPVSDKAEDIQQALVKALRTDGVQFAEARAKNIKKNDDGIFEVTDDEGKKYKAYSVIIATGGKSYPLTGSTGDGYLMAQDLGHTIVPPKPSLVPLETEEKWIFDLQGISLRNTGLKVIDPQKNKVIYEDFGELMFTHFGVTGPMILSASAFVREVRGKKIELDLKPALDEEKLEERILRDFKMYVNKNISNALVDLLPSGMIPAVVMLSGIPEEKKVNQLTKEDRKKLIAALKHFTFTVKGPRPINEAIVTSGGVSVKEINPSTMESKLVPGLFFAGEVIDVDAYTGGFNLQIAFSTGFAAGQNA